MAILLGEIVLRLIAPNWLRYRMAYLNPAAANATFAGDRDWKVENTSDGKFLRFVPGSSFAMQHVEYNLLASIDDKGGRKTPAFPAGGAPIPFLGDSFTFGVGVKDEETFVSLIGAQWQRQVLNLGVPGSTLTDHLRMVRARAGELGYPPLWVFCVFCGNDLLDLLARAEAGEDKTPANSLTPGSEPNKRERGLIESGGWIWEANRLASTNPLLRRSYLLQLVRNGLLRATNRSDDMPRQDPAFLLMDPAQAKLRERLKELWDQALDNLDALQKEFRFQPVFVVIPDRYQVNPELRQLQAAYYGLEAQSLEPEWSTRTIGDGLARHGFPYLDLSQALRGKGDYFYLQDNHLTAHGHRRAAESVGAWLRGFLQAPSKQSELISQ